MEVERKVEAASRVVILTVRGVLGDAELLRLTDALGKESGVERDFSILIDLRQADGKTVSGAGVRAIAAKPLVLSTASRRAIVVPSDLGFGMARMYELLREGKSGPTQVFRDYDEARRWVADSR